MTRKGRIRQRLIGMPQKRIGEAKLDESPDSRDRRGRRREQSALLAGALLGLGADRRPAVARWRVRPVRPASASAASARATPSCWRTLTLGPARTDQG